MSSDITDDNNEVPDGNSDVDTSLIETSILKKFDINVKQELFCRYYTSQGEFFGHGINSYGAAYGHDITNPKIANWCKVRASVLLRQPKICKRIESLLESEGLNDVNVDKHLLSVITQNYDLKAKMMAIREYNKLKTRIVDRIHHSMDDPIKAIEIEILPANSKNLPPRTVEYEEIEPTKEDGE